MQVHMLESLCPLDDPELRCSESVSGVVISLRCAGLPFPVSSSLCSFDSKPPEPCENVYLIQGIY